MGERHNPPRLVECEEQMTTLDQTTLALCEVQDYLAKRLKHAQSGRWDRAIDCAVATLTQLEGVMATAEAGEQDVDRANQGENHV